MRRLEDVFLPSFFLSFFLFLLCESASRSWGVSYLRFVFTVKWRLRRQSETFSLYTHIRIVGAGRRNSKLRNKRLHRGARQWTSKKGDTHNRTFYGNANVSSLIRLTGAAVVCIVLAPRHRHTRVEASFLLFFQLRNSRKKICVLGPAFFFFSP